MLLCYLSLARAIIFKLFERETLLVFLKTDNGKLFKILGSKADTYAPTIICVASPLTE
jgi:hypothetical protein